jgi:MADS-box transcription factor
LEKYQTNSGKILWDEKHKVRAFLDYFFSKLLFLQNRIEMLKKMYSWKTFQSLSAEIDRVKKENDNMQIELRLVSQLITIMHLYFFHFLLIKETTINHPL